MISKSMAALVMGSLVFSASTACAQIVNTTEGHVSGSTVGGSSSWLGIPYASPPIGDLRWRPPQAPQAWWGVRPAHQFSPACMQSGVSMPGEPMPTIDEDCLYLNLWGPRDGRRNLPVMVWIHGGGYTNGSSALPLYWGDSLARRGVIVVTLNYRLGALGFLAHPELTAEAGTSGNYALMDQIAALKWVRSNISAFGGDPGNVTVFGQSAGAMAISMLMASPQAEGLFHRAIAQSGGAFEPVELAPGYLLVNAEQDGVAFAEAVGAASLAELRALPAERLLQSAGAISHPVIEPALMPRSPYEAYVSGAFMDIPLIVGANAEEATSLIDVSAVTAENFAADIRRSWGTLPPPLIEAYAFTDDVEAREARLMFDRDLRFGWNMWAWARLHAQHGSNPVFYYRFSHQPPFPAASAREGWGAAHFAELWYMFDHLNQEDWTWTESDRRLADTMASYWVNFASRGDPNDPDLPRWPAFETATGGDMLELKSEPSVISAPADPQLPVFDAIYDAVRGHPFSSPPRTRAE
jgi:para-nitrobenzyl esterase